MKIPDNFSGFLKEQAEKMQLKMEKLQKEQAAKHFTGEAGAGLVKVVMNGHHKILEVNLDPEVLTESREILEDLIKMASNNALEKANKDTQAQVADLSQFMMPPDEQG